MMRKSKKTLVVSLALAASMAASAFSAFAFSDVSGGEWYAEAVDSMSAKGLVNGYEDGTFRPNDNISRAEVAKILTTYFNVTASTQEEMSDVPAGAWYEDAMRKAVGAGYMQGDSGAVVTYRPEDNITRQEAAVMITRAFNWDPSGSTSFTDSADIASWAANAVATLVDKGVINGYEDGSFKPTAAITRAEFCKMFDTAITVSASTGATATPGFIPGGSTGGVNTSTGGGSTPSGGGGGGTGGGGGGQGLTPATATPVPSPTAEPTAAPSTEPTVAPTATAEPVTDEDKEVIASMAPTEEEQKAIETETSNVVNNVADTAGTVANKTTAIVDANRDTAIADAITAATEEKTTAAVEAKAEELGTTVEEVMANEEVMTEINTAVAAEVDAERTEIEAAAVAELETSAAKQAEAQAAAEAASSFTYGSIYNALRSYNANVVNENETANVNQIVDTTLVQAMGEEEATEEAVYAPHYAYTMMKAQEVLKAQGFEDYSNNALIATVVEAVDTAAAKVIEVANSSDEEGRILAYRADFAAFVRAEIYPKMEAKAPAGYDAASMEELQAAARIAALDLLFNEDAVAYIESVADCQPQTLRTAYLQFVAGVTE